MTKIKIYYHQYGKNDYQQRFQRTFDRIKKSGLLSEASEFHIFTNNPYPQLYDYSVVVHVQENMPSEFPTLSFLKSQSLNDSGYSLYLHSKGVSWPNHPNIQDWVDMMEHFCIEKYMDCIRFLDEGYDIVGCNYQEKPLKHFGGNFWWARNDYIRKLEPLENPKNRNSCEMWVCSQDAKIKVLHNSDINHYQKRYPRNFYSGEIRASIIVLGMHRSFTSLIANCLSKYGINMGNRMMGPGRGNEKGHFENIDIVNLNDKLLKNAGGAWDKPPSHEDILDTGKSMSVEIENTVRSAETVPIWGCKDPRMSLTVECYLPYLKNPVLVPCFRKPQDVADSLMKRSSFPAEKTMNLAKIYNQRIIDTISRYYMITDSGQD